MNSAMKINVFARYPGYWKKVILTLITFFALNEGFPAVVCTANFAEMKLGMGMSSISDNYNLSPHHGRVINGLKKFGRKLKGKFHRARN
jgi:hypothetical protein